MSFIQSLLQSKADSTGHQSSSGDGRPHPAVIMKSEDKTRKRSLSSRVLPARKHRKTPPSGRPNISHPFAFRHIHHESPATVTTALSRAGNALAVAKSPPMTTESSRCSPMNLNPITDERQRQQAPSPPSPAPCVLQNSCPQPSPNLVAPLTTNDMASRFSLCHQFRPSPAHCHWSHEAVTDSSSAWSDTTSVPTPPPRSKARPGPHQPVPTLMSAPPLQACPSEPGIATSPKAAELEPMPSIPALPPAKGLTFAERVLTPAPARPGTAVSLRAVPSGFDFASDGSNDLAGLEDPFVDNAATAHVRTPSTLSAQLCTPLAPPLPLVCRPPLRKKKSFSHVSSWWLFPRTEADAPLPSPPSPSWLPSTPPPPPGNLRRTELEDMYDDRVVGQKPQLPSQTPSQQAAGSSGVERQSYDSASTALTWWSSELTSDGDEPALAAVTSTLSPPPPPPSLWPPQTRAATTVTGHAPRSITRITRSSSIRMAYNNVNLGVNVTDSIALVERAGTFGTFGQHSRERLEIVC